jgi:5'-nucleotidase (lipoprotein e(P4) family)
MSILTSITLITIVNNSYTKNLNCINNNDKIDNNYNTLKWYRTSAEKKAIYHEVFNNAYDKISTKVINNKLESGNWGIISDIDETVLDNTSYQLENLKTCKKFSPKMFYNSLAKENSPATPGAASFTCKIQQLGGTVIFVTNRDGTFDNTVIPSTINNLKKVGICFDNILFAKGSKPTDMDKNSRFNAVVNGDYTNMLRLKNMKAINIIGYFGDNIQDFPNIYQNKLENTNVNDHIFSQFGNTYFELPNPTYGSWEKNKFI